MRCLLLVLAVFAVLAVGCGATQRQPMRRLSSGELRFLSIEHVNLMSASFELIGLHVAVDGNEVAALDGEQPLPPRLCVSRGQANPGPHAIRVEARYRGHGFGVFSYLSGYRFVARASTRIEIAEDAHGLVLRSEGFENGGATAPLEDRPQIRFVARDERADSRGGCFPAGPAPGR